MATRRKAEIATQICILTALNEYPLKNLDFKVLLHPFEKQFNLPPMPVKISNSLSGNIKVISKINIIGISFQIVI